MKTEGAYVAEVTRLMEYVESKEYPLIRIVRTHQHHTNSTPLQAVKILRNLFKVIYRKEKTHCSQHKLKWEGKSVYGQFLCSLDEKLVDKEHSDRWLKFGDIKGETGSTIVAAQDQTLSRTALRKTF
jgi:hypothetical protein